MTHPENVLNALPTASAPQTILDALPPAGGGLPQRILDALPLGGALPLNVTDGLALISGHLPDNELDALPYGQNPYGTLHQFRGNSDQSAYVPGTSIGSLQLQSGPISGPTGYAYNTGWKSINDLFDPNPDGGYVMRDTFTAGTFSARFGLDGVIPDLSVGVWTVKWQYARLFGIPTGGFFHYDVVDNLGNKYTTPPFNMSAAIDAWVIRSDSLSLLATGDPNHNTVTPICVVPGAGASWNVVTAVEVDGIY